jgi:two-component system, NtrC family, nitrogen regulation response regulator NtrX
MSLHIMVVDDEADIRRLLQDILTDEGYLVDIASNGSQARELRSQRNYDLILLDIWMPDVDGITLLREWSSEQPSGKPNCPVVIMSGHGTIEAAVEATRLGAVDFIEKPLSLSKLLHVTKQAVENSRQKRSAPLWLHQQPITPAGRSRAMQQLREQALKAANSEAPVLLLGEAGSGREGFARYLHANSPRANQPWVQLTPASIADEYAALELFGSEQDGVVRHGLLDQAKAGTLLIKGLEDAAPVLQRLLLATLETHSFQRLGSSTSEPLRTRLICTANTSFPQAVAAGSFRPELYLRLNTITLQVPALRERSEDVPDLLRHHAERIADDERLPLRRFGLSAQNRLRNYPWPGNVQELRNLVRRLLILGGNEEIGLDEVERELHAQIAEDEPLVKHDLLALPLREAREHFERAYLLQQLSLCHGKVGQLAKRVGMERTHLYRKLRILGVDFRQLAED